ncbi:hypothetical protein ACFQY3_16915 [Paenibacillus farraposensis]|nr:hypothetical protein [Paenibacillus farraposensis]
MGIIAFIFTALRFYQERRPLRVTTEVAPHQYGTPIYDENANQIDEAFEDCLSVELTIFNKSLRNTTISTISHDSSFDFRGYLNNDEWPKNIYENGISVAPGAIIKIKKIMVPLDQEMLNIKIQTTYATIKLKVNIINN